MTKQALTSFSIGRYKDEVMFDVDPMQVGHVLLGRPWQYDRHVIHDGFLNHYTLKQNDKTITLVSLTPQQVYELKLEKDKRREVSKAKGKKQESGELEKRENPYGEKKRVKKTKIRGWE